MVTLATNKLISSTRWLHLFTTFGQLEPQLTFKRWPVTYTPTRQLCSSNQLFLFKASVTVRTEIVDLIQPKAGCVAQLIEWQSLACELSLSCAWLAAETITVGKPSVTGQQTSLSAFWVDKWAVSWNQMCAIMWCRLVKATMTVITGLA